jgi:small-conductance mechanosensitive channel
MEQNDYHFTQSLQTGLDKLLGFIPQVIGLILLVLIGWFVASIAKKIIIKVLRRLRFERAITLSPAGNYVTRVIEHPTNFVGKLAYWIILLAFLSFAISSLNVPALSLMILGIYRYIPNIIAAVLIFLVASAITIGAEAFVQKVLKFSPLSKVIGAVIPALTMSIAIFMILNQLHIAQDIVNITYTALMGSIALGLALAFGLGGREVAARILAQAYDSAQAKSEDVKSDMRQAAANTREQARRARSKADDAAQ